VVAKVEKPKEDKEASSQDKDGIERATIVSSGYNEVPPKSKPCVLDTRYEQCYRDWLQEYGAAQINNCPVCGKKVVYPEQCPSTTCGKPLKRRVKYCPACEKDIFSSVVCSCGTRPLLETPLSGKHTSSKMLDVCRSLHAEETAMLNLAKLGIVPDDDFVLYTTTYPCNLCANKIAALQIGRVVYAEVYTMPEAEEILTKAGVKVDRFTGVKSTAYFRLYGR
jgi:deoxycytidylate deaminase